MQRSKKSKNTTFERKSQFDDNRDSYVAEDGSYVYLKWVQLPNGKYEHRVAAVIPFTEETADIIISLDEDDHRQDLQERYDAENADYSFCNQRTKRQNDSEDDFDTDPISNIADPHSDFTSEMFAEDKPENPMVVLVEAFVREKLTPPQQDLFFAHYGEMKFLEDIRREEEALTGKKISRQAMHNRLTKILDRVCKELGTERPRQIHKKSK